MCVHYSHGDTKASIKWSMYSDKTDVILFCNYFSENGNTSTLCKMIMVIVLHIIVQPYLIWLIGTVNAYGAYTYSI